MNAADDEVRQNLIDSALRLFSERGRDRVSLREIAADAGVTHGSIRYHFGTKDKLYVATITQLVGHGECDDISRIAGEPPTSAEDGERALRSYIHRIVAFQARVGENRTAALGLLQAEVSRDGGPDPVFFKKMIKPAHERLKGIIRCIRPDITDDAVLEIITFNIIFQCVMVRIGRGTIMKLLGSRTIGRGDVTRIADLITEITIGGLRSLDASAGLYRTSDVVTGNAPGERGPRACSRSRSAPTC